MVGGDSIGPGLQLVGARFSKFPCRKAIRVWRWKGTDMVQVTPLTRTLASLP